MVVVGRILKQVGKKIKKYREQKGYTQEELAEKIRVSSTYIGFIEQGLRNPSLKTADKIARALGVKLTDIIS